MSANTFTAKQLAARFRVDLSTIYAWARQKNLPIEKTGEAFRFTGEQLQQFAASSEPLLTAQEVADRLRISLVAFHGMRARRAIPFIKLSRVRYRFLWSEVEAALMKSRHRAALPAKTFRVEPWNYPDRPHLKFSVVEGDARNAPRKFFKTEAEAVAYARKRNRGAGMKAIAPIPDLWRDADPVAPAWRVHRYLPGKEDEPVKYYAVAYFDKKPVKRFFDKEDKALAFANEENLRVALERARATAPAGEAAPEPGAILADGSAPAPAPDEITPAMLAGILAGQAEPGTDAILTSALSVAASKGAHAMPKTAFIVCKYKHPVTKWVCNGYVGGKRQRRFFQSEAEARTYAHLQNTELLNKGREAIDFPSWLRTMAQRCHDMLSPLGVTIEAATEFYLAAKAREAKSIELKACIELLVTSRKSAGVTRRYLAVLRETLMRFAKAVGPKLRVSEITTREIDGYLGELRCIREPEKFAAPATRTQTRRLLAALFSYAKTHKYCAENPVIAAVKVRIPETEVGIFTVQQIADLLAHAPAEWLPFLAIGAFGGIRCAELLRLDWKDVKLDAGMILLPGKKTKSSRHRHVKIEPCLDAWIRPVAKFEGRIAPAASFVPHEVLREAMRAAKITEWVRNGLRHSFASYHLAHFKNIGALQGEMGHSTTNLIYAHYRALVHESEAAKYWKIFPLGTAESAKVVNMEAEKAGK